MFTNTRNLMFVAALAALSACGPDAELTIDEESYVEDLEQDTGALTAVSDDDLNGIYRVTMNGQPFANGDAVISSWTAIGIRLEFDGVTTQLVRSGDVLTGSNVSLTVKQGTSSGVNDDSLDGTINGQAVVLKRDTYVKAPIVLQFPGDRPFRSFLTETIMPMAQRDRESYVTHSASKTGPWLRDCELYRSGSWLRKYFKGETWSEQSTSFHNVINATNYVKGQPRRMTKQYKFTSAINANLKDPSLAGLAISSFSMYFPTAAGRSLRMPITSDAVAYFITDRPVRQEKIGLVVMDTPTHNPLASTFGRQLLDLGEIPDDDIHDYSVAMMDLMAKSSNARATALSGVAKSALVDWYAVMAIEDYRGVAFGWPTLSWGYNMTNVQFYGLIARLLARPGQVDSMGNPVKGQVIVGWELKPGEASYADVLNNGNDMQEYSDMAKLKQLTTQYLRQYHPAKVAAVEAAFAGIVPATELDSRARADIFHYICAQLYDSRGRTAVLKQAGRGDAVVNSVVALIDTLQAESAQLEAFIVSKGYVKSNVAAPKSSGY